MTSTKNKKMPLKIIALVGFTAVAASVAIVTNLPGGTPIARVEVVASFPHDTGAFCQGLAVEGETLYEGTGQYGRSSLREVELKSGRVLKSRPLSQEYFGEGITILDGKIYQLTWKGKQCVVWDKSLNPIETKRYRWKRASEGWGIADDGKVLYVSDGSNNIIVVDPTDLTEIRRMRIRDGRRRLDKINELEFYKGELLANIWYVDRIARIDPESGELKGWIDCSDVYPAKNRPDREHVLNGIAYDEKADRLFITGKNWPKLYEIKILD